MSPELSRRVAAALGTHQVTLDERSTIVDALVTAEDWSDLPGKIRALVETIEARSGWVDDAHVVALVAAGPDSVSPDDLAGITPLWSQAVQDDLLPVVAEVYQDAAGTVHAQLIDATDLPTIPPVTSLASEAYLAQATNTFEEVGADLWETARSELLDGFQQGESIPELRDRLRNSAGLTGRTATLVARTQVLDASNAGSYDTARVSGLDLLKGWEATPDARTRDTHSAAGAFYQGDGMIALADPFTVGGSACERPHDPVLPASERYNCRCTLIYAMAPEVPPPPKDRSAQIEAWHEQRVAQIRAQHEQRVADIARRHARKVADIEATHADQAVVDAVRTRHAARLAKLTAAYEARRTALAEERARRLGEHAVRSEAPEAPDLTRAARERQARIDTARTVAQASIQLDEVAANRLSARALAHRARGAHTSGGIDQATLDELLAAAERLDYDGYRAIADRVGRQAGLTSIGRAGEQTAFDRTRQSSIGADLPEGTTVTIVRRGYVLDDDGTGKPVVLERAAVQQREPLPSAVAPGPAGVPSPVGPTPVPVQASLMQAQTIPEVQRAFVREWQAILAQHRPRLIASPSVRFIPDGDVQTAREHAEGLLRALERFPRVPMAVSHRTMRHYAQADLDTMTIQFGNGFARDRAAYLASLREAGTPYVFDPLSVAWHPMSTASPQGVAMHEFGHLLHHMLSPLEPDPTVPGVLVFRYSTKVDDAVKAIVRDLATERGVPADELIKREIGEYAASNTHELIGEAFADAMINGDAASVLSRRIMAVLVDEYDRTTGVARPGPVPGRVLPSAPRPTVDVSQSLAEYRTRQEGIRRIIRSDMDHRTEALPGGQVADTFLLTYTDGSKLVVKGRVGIDPRRGADAEELGALVAQVMGVRAPTMVRAGNQLTMEFIEGRTGSSLSASQIARLADSREGRQLGLMDAIIGITDRAQNWIAVGGRERVAAIDFGVAFGRGADFRFGPENPFTRYLVEPGPGDSLRLRETIDVRAEEVGAIRAALQALEPEFVRLGRSDWHAAMMERVDELERRALAAAVPVEPGLARGVAEALQALTTGRTLAEVRTLLEALPEAKDALKVARWATTTQGLTRSLNALATRRGLTLPSAKELKAIQAAERAALVAERKAARAAAAEAARVARAEKARAAEAKREAARLAKEEKARQAEAARLAKEAGASKAEIRLIRLSEQTPTGTRQLGGGAMADVRLLTYPDGSQIVEKIYGPHSRATLAEVRSLVDSEVLGAKVFETLGVRAPAVVQAGARGRLIMEYMDGEVGGGPYVSLRAHAALEAFMGQSDEGRLFGLVDFLIGNTDRNSGNWLLTHDRHFIGIDFGSAFQDRGVLGVQSRSAFTRYLLIPDAYRLAKTVDVAPEDLAIIRRRLEALEPRFAEAKRLTWFRQMMRRLAELEKRASGTKRIIIS